MNFSAPTSWNASYGASVETVLSIKSEDGIEYAIDELKVARIRDDDVYPGVRVSVPARIDRVMLVAFTAIALLFTLGPLLAVLWKAVLGGGLLAGGFWFAKRAGDAIPEVTAGDGSGSVGADIGALSAAARAEYANEAGGLKQASKESAGAVLVAEGIVGLENPFNSKARGGLYSSMIGVLCGVALFFYAPMVSTLVTGEPDDVRVEGTAVEWVDYTTTNDDGETSTRWKPVY